MPSAITRMAMTVKAGVRRRVRRLKRRSRARDSSQFQDQMARVCSRIRAGLPKARKAAWRASSGVRPRSRCSSSSRSRSERSSRSRSTSRFRVGHHFISALLGGGPHHACDSFRHLLPLRLFDHELLLAFIRQAVVFEFPISVRCSLPFGDNPSSPLQAMQRGIERAVLRLEEFIRAPLNVLPDLVTVSRSKEKRPQDEHVKRSLEEPDPLLRLLGHRRHSTLNLARMVDTRLSIVNGTKQGVDSRMTITGLSTNRVFWRT